MARFRTLVNDDVYDDVLVFSVLVLAAGREEIGSVMLGAVRCGQCELYWVPSGLALAALAVLAVCAWREVYCEVWFRVVVCP